MDEGSDMIGFDIRLSSGGVPAALQDKACGKDIEGKSGGGQAYFERNSCVFR